MKMEKIVRIIRNVYLGLLVTIITFLGVFLVSSLFSKTDYTSVFGLSFFEVESYSMYPELTKGDLVVVKKLDASEYEVDMVVTYIKEGEKTPTTHKIVKIEGNIITTRGVNTQTNNADDEPFDVSCIIGRVVSVWHGYGNVRNFVTNPLGIISILLIGFFIVEGFNYLENYFKEKEKNKQLESVND
ncbi:MAG: signal peptidase I [Erysipelotrichaceae bacterium]|nr:signal peptidase I [Erysipelotrichaceae bacterium]